MLGEAAQHREQLRDLALSLEELERAPVLLLDLVREPVQGLQRARQAGPQRELLERALARGGCRREHVQELRASSTMPCSGPATRTTSQSPSMSLLSWSTSRSSTQWRHARRRFSVLARQRGERRLAPSAAHALPLPAREVGEIGGVCTAGGGVELGIVVEALGRVLPDRRQHHEAGVAVRAGLPHQALVDQRGEPVERVDRVRGGR